MKSVKSLLLIALLALGFVACEKDPATDEKSPVIKVDATEIKLNSHGESLEIGYRIENVEPSERKSIKVENLAEWLDVEVGEETILLTAEKNNTTQGRVINIIVKYEGAESVEISVMQENIEVPRENLTLELEVSEIGPTSITIDITASHPDMTWIPMVTYKEYWDQKPSDEEVYISDLAYFEYLAENAGISREEFLVDMLGMGSQEGIVIDGLTPNTEFVIYAYGLTADGERTTDIVAREATTEKPYEGDITFDFDIKEEDYIMEFVVTPSHKGVNYYHGVATEAEIEAWKELAATDNLREAIQIGDIEANIDMFMSYDFIDLRKDYFDMCNVYDTVDDGWERVKADTKYILYAAKWDEECQLLGEVSTAEYTTAPAEMSSNKFTVEIREVNQSQVTVAVKTTTYDPYVIIPMKSEDIEGMTDDEIFNYVTTAYDYLVREYTHNGDYTRTFSRMRPETDYTILVFGNTAGTMTTEMVKVEVTTTASGDPNDCTFTFNIVPGADTVWLEIDPSDKGHFYNWLIYPADITAEEAKSYIHDTILGKYYEGDIPAFSSWELTQGYLTTTAYDLLPETDYKIGVVIMDYDTAEFITDMVFSEVFTTEAMQYADIDISVEWSDYWDGEALFNYGYSQFEGCDNEAILPVSVNIEGDYDEYYYAIYSRDLTDEQTLPDEMFYDDLSQGYSIKSMIVSVPFDTEMTIVAVAYDAMFMPSKLFRELIYLTKEGATPVEEFEKIGGSPSALEARTLTHSDKGIIRGERKQSVEIVVSDAYRKAIEKERKAKLATDVAERLEKCTQPIRRIAR
ncbi:MAG: BACON domain-containing protein [Alistipes sp.]|nr:BACON domain-containing protein [Alistipes sp.]